MNNAKRNTFRYIINTCLTAAASASYSRRQKIKVDDFKFAIRKDPGKLGRVQELFLKKKMIDDARKQFNCDDDKIDAVAVKDAARQEKGEEGKSTKG
jgi:transcription initiation factor TFIID subunit 13